MATNRISLTPASALSDASGTNGFPEVKVAGSNVASMSLAFDAAADEEAQWQVGYAPTYGSGNVTVKVRWYGDTATSGNVVWAAAIACLTPETDSTDIETNAWGTAATATDGHLGTTAHRVMEASVTVTSLDSITTGDMLWIRVYRDANNASDTMAGDAQVVEVLVEYSDT
jgi:hypothetical protein